MKTNETKFERANRTLNKAESLLLRNKITLSAYSVIHLVLEELLMNNESEFIQSGVKEFFVKENYTVRTDGIGWKVSW